MQAYTMQVISKVDPIKYILWSLFLNGQLRKWSVILKQYNLIYIPQRAVKEEALVYFLIDHPIPDDLELNDDLRGKDVFFIDILYL